MITLDFTPADTLFFREAKPLGAGGAYGRGARWPLPTVLHSAVRSALLRLAGCAATGTYGFAPRPGEKQRWVSALEFQWLNTQGPFPVQRDKGGGETAYFPIPLDLVPRDKDAGEHHLFERLKLIPNSHGRNNLPPFLAYIAASCVKPAKMDSGQWLDEAAFKAYLQGGRTEIQAKATQFWDIEHRIGVAIDGETQTAEAGRLYAAEHLRLRDDVVLRFRASEPPAHKPRMAGEKGRTAGDLDGQILQLGGEQRFGKVQKAARGLSLPEAEITGRHVKWVLLSPAVFAHGWRPGWIDETGRVRLRVVPPNSDLRRERRRRKRETGERYSEGGDNCEEIHASLVAACVGKPQVITGWDLLPGKEQRAGEPRATLLAAPSGSVYYFEAAGEADARKLAGVLQGRCRSDSYGEKGLGLGVCGLWNAEQAGLA